MLGFQRMKAMAKHRSHSVAFKRQVAQEFIAGETLHGLSKRHDISRQLIRIWVNKYEAGALDDDVQAADLLQEYEAKIAALELAVRDHVDDAAVLHEAVPVGDRRLKLQFRGAVITSDAGLLAYRELDDALGLTACAAEVLADARTGKNGRHALVGLLRQSVFGRLAGYEDVNDAERLCRDPAMRWIVGHRASHGAAA